MDSCLTESFSWIHKKFCSSKGSEISLHYYKIKLFFLSVTWFIDMVWPYVLEKKRVLIVPIQKYCIFGLSITQIQWKLMSLRVYNYCVYKYRFPFRHINFKLSNVCKKKGSFFVTIYCTTVEVQTKPK